MNQLIPFDPSKGGTTPDLCLANVCAGYGIANKYGSAWEAWGHTQQHPERDVPTGVAVPIFYSYTTTLDGVTKNYGHINVQLPDGRVWSDGNIYLSIDAYVENHAPVFVGWGESVNDIKVIEEGEDMIPDDDNDFARWSETFQMIRGRVPTREEFQASAVGRTWLSALEILEDSAEAAICQNWQSVGQVAVTDNWQKQIEDLTAELAAATTGFVPYAGSPLYTKSTK